jgi:DNA-binding transcriptional regulator PaaX
MYKHRSNNRRNNILKTLANTRKLLLAFAEDCKNWDDPDIPCLLGYSGRRALSYEDRFRIKKAQAKRALYSLKQKKYIEVRKIGGKMVYILTNKGRIAALKELIRITDERNDGKILLVSFDIPVQGNDIRVKLRYLLKDFGFEQIQKSVWGSRRDVGKPFSALIKDMKAEKWIKLFLSDEIPVE